MKQAGALFLRETQIGSTYFVEPVANTKPGERKGGIAACNDDEMESWWKVLKEEGERLVDRGLGNDVVIFQNQDAS